VPATADRQVSGTSAALPVPARLAEKPAETRPSERRRQDDAAPTLPLVPPAVLPATPAVAAPAAPASDLPDAVPLPPRRPPVQIPPARPPYPSLDDDRRRARARYRQAAAAGERLTGEQLGGEFGRSERWGRDQIAAVRLEDAHPPKVPSSVH
jgi:hypothetical protein